MPKDAPKPSADKNIAYLFNSIQIALDDYDDIFSDFDTSPYSGRLLSEDFLSELRRRYAQTSKGSIEVNFALPDAGRDLKVEGLIKRRLRQHFLYQVKEAGKEIDALRRRGLLHMLAGFFLLAIEVFTFEIESLPAKLIKTLIVPAGWYGMYSGLEHMFYYPSELIRKQRFYERFANAKYRFLSEEKLVQAVAEQKSLLISSSMNAKAVTDTVATHGTVKIIRK